MNSRYAKTFLATTEQFQDVPKDCEDISKKNINTRKGAGIELSRLASITSRVCRGGTDTFSFHDSPLARGGENFKNIELRQRYRSTHT